ncbi:MAG: AAA family ATPase, partial [Metallibacterium sp.]
DIPGVGKTTLAHALAATCGLGFQRVQFTSDLTPTDIIGVGIYEHEQRQFKFHPGPLFTELLLADEINRGTPKVQSALLEAMAEGQVSVEGETRALPSVFTVIATQNPLDLAGTFPLPDSQLDRFLMRLSLGYPDAMAERALLTGSALLRGTTAVLVAPDLLALRVRVRAVSASPAVLDYLQALLAASRDHADIRVGLSPRAGLALLAAARAWALLGGRTYVMPEDVQAVFIAVAAHRLQPQRNTERAALASVLLAEVSVRA